MGDLGYQDADGRVWFLGRKAHRVTTESGDLFTITNEAIFNQHPKVFRTALVGVGPRGKQKPVLCVELHPGEKATPALEQELRHLGTTFLYARQIQTFLFHPGFPVDIRHNSKIFREKLAVWAEEQLA
ncbi:peptide synthase [compost metagenome]